MQLFELIKLTFIERKNICSNLPDRSKKIKRNLFLTNQQAVKHKITIEFCFISASFALTFANLTNEK